MCVERKDNLKQEKQNKLSKNDTNLISLPFEGN